MSVVLVPGAWDQRVLKRSSCPKLIIEASKSTLIDDTDISVDRFLGKQMTSDQMPGILSKSKLCLSPN